VDTAPRLAALSEEAEDPYACTLYQWLPVASLYLQSWEGDAQGEAMLLPFEGPRWPHAWTLPGHPNFGRAIRGSLPMPHVPPELAERNARIGRLRLADAVVRRGAALLDYCHRHMARDDATHCDSAEDE
jgi:hypothetical protein